MDFSQLLNQVLGAAQKGGKAVADSPLNSFGGGAGIQADLKTFQMRGVLDLSVSQLSYLLPLHYQSDFRPDLGNLRTPARNKKRCY